MSTNLDDGGARCQRTSRPSLKRHQRDCPLSCLRKTLQGRDSSVTDCASAEAGGRMAWQTLWSARRERDDERRRQGRLATTTDAKRAADCSSSSGSNRWCRCAAAAVHVQRSPCLCARPFASAPALFTDTCCILLICSCAQCVERQAPQSLSLSLSRSSALLLNDMPVMSQTVARNEHLCTTRPLPLSLLHSWASRQHLHSYDCTQSVQSSTSRAARGGCNVKSR